MDRGPDLVRDIVPVIDLSPFGGRDPAAAQSTIDAVGEACRSLGFFIATGHGVDAAVTQRFYDLARDFFDQPERIKGQATPGGKIPGGLSFMPLATESLGGTIGVIAPGDYKESLNYGPRLTGGPWPATVLPLHVAFEQYFAQMEQLAQRLRDIFCAAVGLPEGYFEADFVGHLSALRVINYPEPKTPPLPGQMRAGAHTDYGFLTILRSEASSGGLQVQSRGGDWIDVPALDDAFVINIGDAFMRWTNDVWVSTPHRVINPPPAGAAGSRRQSIPFFSNPNATATIRCLDQFCDADRPARYPPVSYGDYIALKTQQAYA
jgi:isopenicillin N synthase-like dioxygenase